MSKRERVGPEEKGKQMLREIRQTAGSKKHVDQATKQAAARAVDNVKLLADLGNEEAFVKQIKETFPGISASELLKKIEQFRELKKLRSTRS